MNSGTLRELVAPSDSAVCPTSRTMRNFAGTHVDALKAEAGRLVGPSAATLTWCGFGAAACLAACFDFDEAACARDLLSFDEPLSDEPLKASDNQLAWLIPIGKTANPIATAITVPQRRAPRPAGAIFSADNGNPGFPQIEFPFAHQGNATLTGILIEALLKIVARSKRGTKRFQNGSLCPVTLS